MMLSTSKTLLALALVTTMAGCASKKPVEAEAGVLAPAVAENPVAEQGATTSAVDGGGVQGTDVAGADVAGTSTAGAGTAGAGTAGAGTAGAGGSGSDNAGTAAGNAGTSGLVDGDGAGGFESDPANYSGDTGTRVIYFAFDRAEIPAAAYATLKAHARYLAANPGATLRLEGHADERGTPEYNVALAERRGKIVQQFLVLNGARATQLEVISYGEEKPAVLGSDDLSWAKNRRVELAYSAGQP